MNTEDSKKQTVEEVKTPGPFRYDVAFSFSMTSESIATAINQLLEDRITTFLYSKKQEEIAGKDGEEEFNRVFGQEARLVVILFSEDWGKTPWTRIEETAIRNRAYEKGFDFTLFVMTEAGLQPPAWLPKNRLWSGLDRYGIEGVAAVIESRVQELDGNVRALTAADKAKQKAKEIEFEHSREAFLHSKQAVDSARTEVTSLFSEIKKITTQIQSSNLQFTIDGNDRELMVLSSGYTLFLNWGLQYSNSLDHSSFRMQIFKGAISYNGRMAFDDPTRMVDEKYYFDVTMSGRHGWRLQSIDGDFYKTDQLVERWIGSFMDRIKDRPSGE